LTSHSEMSAELQPIADAIIAALPEATSGEELRERMKDVASKTGAYLSHARWKALLCAGLCIEDALKEHPDIDRDALLRLIANEFIYVASFFVRSLKRRAGAEISPARFAIVAYGIAEALSKDEWSDETAANIAGDGGSLREAVKEEARRRQAEVTDDELRALWRANGGEFHGPNVETGYMPEEKLLPFLRRLGAGPEDM
jgi:hypothetical protein